MVRIGSLYRTRRAFRGRGERVGLPRRRQGAGQRQEQGVAGSRNDVEGYHRPGSLVLRPRAEVRGAPCEGWLNRGLQKGCALGVGIGYRLLSHLLEVGRGARAVDPPAGRTAYCEPRGGTRGRWLGPYRNGAPGRRAFGAAQNSQRDLATVHAQCLPSHHPDAPRRQAVTRFDKCCSGGSSQW